MYHSLLKQVIYLIINNSSKDWFFCVFQIDFTKSVENRKIKWLCSVCSYA